MERLTRYLKSIKLGYAILSAATVWLSTLSSNLHAELVVIVNPASPVESVSMDDVRKLFLGRMQFLPGTETTVKVVDQKETSANFATFYRQVANKDATQITRYRASFIFSGQGVLPVVVDNDNAVLDTLTKHENAIGYVDRKSLANTQFKVVMTLH